MPSCAPGVTDPPSFVDGVGSDSKTFTAMQSNVQSFDEHSDMLSKTEQSWQLEKTSTRSYEQQVCDQLPCEQQTGRLVKEVRLSLSVCK